MSTYLHKSKFQSVFVDETADCSNKEQLVMCLRWIDDSFEAHEEFVGLYHMENFDAPSIAKQIKDALEQMNLPLSKLRGQCYDGCATMSGPKTGVEVQLKKEEPKALYTHCYAHATNLACSDSIRQVETVRDAHDTVREITKLVKYSPKRDTPSKNERGNELRSRGKECAKRPFALPNQVDRERQGLRQHPSELLYLAAVLGMVSVELL